MGYPGPDVPAKDVGHGYFNAVGVHAGDLSNLYIAADGSTRADHFTAAVTLGTDAPIRFLAPTAPRSSSTKSRTPMARTPTPAGAWPVGSSNATDRRRKCAGCWHNDGIAASAKPIDAQFPPVVRAGMNELIGN